MSSFPFSPFISINHTHTKLLQSFIHILNNILSENCFEESPGEGDFFDFFYRIRYYLQGKFLILRWFSF